MFIPDPTLPVKWKLHITPDLYCRFHRSNVAWYLWWTWKIPAPYQMNRSCYMSYFVNTCILNSFCFGYGFRMVNWVWLKIVYVWVGVGSSTSFIIWWTWLWAADCWGSPTHQIKWSCKDSDSSQWDQLTMNQSESSIDDTWPWWANWREDDRQPIKVTMTTRYSGQANDRSP